METNIYDVLIAIVITAGIMTTLGLILLFNMKDR